MVVIASKGEKTSLTITLFLSLSQRIFLQRKTHLEESRLTLETYLATLLVFEK